MNNQDTYNIYDDFKIRICIEDNKFNILPEKLFLMAARKNKKRRFLFVSKVLGKHIPVNPKLSLLIGRLLGDEYGKEIYGVKSSLRESIVSAINTGNRVKEVFECATDKLLDLPEKTLFIGFAETATALGHSVFASFNNAYYIHTTREEILNFENVIKFEEEHSHATSHRLYPIDFDAIDSDAPIVLVDDEITTGKTSLNIIEAINDKYPRKNYTIVSILDWRTKKDKLAFTEMENKLNIKINTVSLLSGNIKIENESLGDLEIDMKTKHMDSDDISFRYIYLDSIFPEGISFSSVDSSNNVNSAPYLKFTGRFGIDSAQNMILNEQLERAGELLRKRRRGKKTLCMGTGEFMYIPMLLSTHLGDGVSYQSTTRSPILPLDKSNYGARNAFVYNSQDDNAIVNYFYNIPNGLYDDIFLFLERKIPNSKMKFLLDTLKTLGIRDINIVTFKGRD